MSCVDMNKRLGKRSCFVLLQPERHSNLRELNLRDIGVEGETLAALLGALQHCTRLQVLDISSLEITAEEIPLLAPFFAATGATTLRSLVIEENELESSGVWHSA